jgi:hypothetical protein
VSDQIEVSGEALGAKGSVKGPAHYLQTLIMVLNAIALAVMFLSLQTHVVNADAGTGRLHKSILELTSAIKMQTCLATVPQEQRSSAYNDRSHHCHFMARE